jgi:hypothetical protein
MHCGPECVPEFYNPSRRFLRSPAGLLLLAEDLSTGLLLLTQDLSTGLLFQFLVVAGFLKGASLLDALKNSGVRHGPVR